MTLLRTAAIIVLSLFLLGANGCIRIGSGGSATRDGGVFRSDEGGKTWGQITFAGKDAQGKDIQLNNTSVVTLLLDPQNPDTLFWGTVSNGILRSDNRGLQWKPTGLTAGGYRVIAPDPRTPGILYAATGGVVRKSTDDGVTWNVIYTETRPGQGISHLLVDFFDSRTLYVTTSDGTMIRSTDFGSTWALHSQLLTSIQELFFHPRDSRVMFARTDARGLLVSRDAGQTWGALSESLAQLPGSGPIFAMAISNVDPQRMYLATPRGLLLSLDGGATWNDAPTLLPLNTVPINFIALHPSNTTTLYLVVGNKLHTTIDGGNQWTVSTLPTSRPITVFFVHPESPEQLFFGTMQVRR